MVASFNPSSLNLGPVRRRYPTGTRTEVNSPKIVTKVFVGYFILVRNLYFELENFWVVEFGGGGGGSTGRFPLHLLLVRELLFSLLLMTKFVRQNQRVIPYIRQKLFVCRTIPRRHDLNPSKVTNVTPDLNLSDRN